MKAKRSLQSWLNPAHGAGRGELQLQPGTRVDPPRMKDKPDGPDVEVLPVGASAGASAGVADADTEGWISSLGRKTGGWMEDNPAKSTLILTITGGIIKEKVVDRALSWVWVWGKGLFARGAEQKLDEAIASESGDAVANATGMGLGIGVLKLLGGLFKVAP